MKRWIHNLLRQQTGAMDQSKPVSGFAELLQNYLHLVDEIRSTLRTARFFVICAAGSTRSNQLSANVSSYKCVWQLLRDLDNRGPKFKKSFRQVDRPARHASLHFAMVILHFALKLSAGREPLCEKELLGRGRLAVA
jgi:hypothetical protein